MGHYAFLDENNIVVKVITGRNENELDIDWEKHYGDFEGLICKRTSYNTIWNEHRTGGTPFRGNFAGIGFYYDQELDVFIPPKCHEEAILDETKYRWNCTNETHTQAL